MNELAHLFSSFEGRISRRTYWSGCGLMVGGQVLLTAALARTAGLGLGDFSHGDRRAMSVNLVVIAFFFWPSLALAVKRLHDRGLPGWWAGLLHVLMFLFYANQALGRTLIRDKSMLLVSLVPGIMLMVVGCWLVTELLFLVGTPGPNAYGPQPAGEGGRLLARGPAAAQAQPLAKPGE